MNSLKPKHYVIYDGGFFKPLKAQESFTNEARHRLLPYD